MGKKIEISKDQVAFGASALAAASCGAFHLITPKKAQDMFFDSEKGRNDTGARIQGHVTLVSAALLAGVLRDGNLSCQGKKDLHKVSGAAWATFVGHEGYSMYKGTLKKDAFGIANAVGAAALAGTHLYLGFKKDGENKKKEDKPKKDEKKDDKKK